MVHKKRYFQFSDPNKAIDIGDWSFCGGGRLVRFYCIYKYIAGDISIYICIFTVNVYIYVCVSLRTHNYIGMYIYTHIHTYTVKPLSPVSIALFGSQKTTHRDILTLRN